MIVLGILFYFIIGLISAISTEILMISYKMNDDTTDLERLSWIIFWPLYVLIFTFLGNKKS